LRRSSASGIAKRAADDANAPAVTAVASKTSVLPQNANRLGPCRIASNGKGNLSGCSDHACFLCPPKGTRCYGDTF
jgi:hypothetical protein